MRRGGGGHASYYVVAALPKPRLPKPRRNWPQPAAGGNRPGYRQVSAD
jgi:hypothetical protein